jgi:dimethylsulfoniopropionate demethylase
MPFTVRTRRSPFFERSHAAGAQAYRVYNHMLIAGDFVSTEKDYRHLKQAVQIWDVGCERQVEIAGPDAARLVQMSTPRDIGAMRDDQCFYIPTVDRDGNMTNDPVLLRVAPERYWVSISDSDLILYYKGLAAGLGLDVAIREPEVSPLAIQGPSAQALVARVWGEEAASIGFFRHVRVDVEGVPMILARSGYSLQGGFELYFEGVGGGDRLWDRLMEAGRDLDVRAGSPNQTERTEGGLLSYRTDITPDMTPFEAGLGRYCTMDRETGCLAHQALREKRDPTRQVRPIEIDGDRVPPMTRFWEITKNSGENVGRISSSAWSFDFGCNVAIGLVNRAHWSPGTELMVQAPDTPRRARVKSEFWSLARCKSSRRARPDGVQKNAGAAT